MDDTNPQIKSVTTRCKECLGYYSVKVVDGKVYQGVHINGYRDYVWELMPDAKESELQYVSDWEAQYTCFFCANHKWKSNARNRT
jgi:hypothetical protein